jgi:uncharacterized membrane protein
MTLMMTNCDSKQHPDAAQSVRDLLRLERLADIVYGVSFLFMLMQIDRPDASMLGSSEAMREYLRGQASTLQIYFTSFLLVAFYWQSHLAMMKRFKGSDSLHRWFQLGGLMGVALLPYVNDLLELMPLEASIQIIYSLVMVQIGFFDVLILLHGWRHPELMVDPQQQQKSWAVLLESALEPGICLISIVVAIVMAPEFWEWTFLLMLPGYGIVGLLERQQPDQTVKSH